MRPCGVLTLSCAKHGRGDDSHELSESIQVRITTVHILTCNIAFAYPTSVNWLWHSSLNPKNFLSRVTRRSFLITRMVIVTKVTHNATELAMHNLELTTCVHHYYGLLEKHIGTTVTPSSSNLHHPADLHWILVGIVQAREMDEGNKEQGLKCLCIEQCLV